MKVWVGGRGGRWGRFDLEHVGGAGGLIFFGVGARWGRVGDILAALGGWRVQFLGLVIQPAQDRTTCSPKVVEPAPKEVQPAPPQRVS